MTQGRDTSEYHEGVTAGAQIFVSAIDGSGDFFSARVVEKNDPSVSLPNAYNYVLKDTGTFPSTLIFTTSFTSMLRIPVLLVVKTSTLSTTITIPLLAPARNMTIDRSVDLQTGKLKMQGDLGDSMSGIDGIQVLNSDGVSAGYDIIIPSSIPGTNESDGALNRSVVTQYPIQKGNEHLAIAHTFFFNEVTGNKPERTVFVNPPI